MDAKTKRLLEKMELNSHWPLVANRVFMPYDPKLVEQITQTGKQKLKEMLDELDPIS